ncbi:MAG: arylesterase [Burkholderiales bacterium]|nr:arylesterase [Burkholderiales bacterium]
MVRVLVLALLLGFPLAARCAGTILVFGDSISAAYGLPAEAGWVSLLEQRLARHAADYRVVNASISGETAAGGRRRIDAALAQHRPDIVVLELGGNDGLRGAAAETIQADIDAIVTTSLKRKARVVLLGMRLPPNYGADYVRRFQDLYGVVAKKHRIALVPFLFEGFGERYELFQSDGIHPTRDAQPIMLETVWTALAPLLKLAKPAALRR